MSYFVIVALLLLFLSYAPNLWVRFVIHKHNKPISALPGTGGELAQHLLDRFQLHDVNIEETSKNADYYNPTEKIIGLSPEVFRGKSLSAVAIAAHEVGHAIQYARKEPVSQLRQRYLPIAAKAQSLGVFILSATPLLGMLIRNPAVLVAMITVGVVAMLGSVLCHTLVLPLEYDASFGKALPILSEGYIADNDLPAIRQVLRAAALTYVAGAVADIVSVWRWISILR